MSWLESSIMARRGLAKGKPGKSHAITEASQGQYHYVYGPFAKPVLTVDRQGNVYILERSGNALRGVERAGTIRTVAGTGEEGASGDGGDGRAARLKGPKDVCVDLDDSVLIADTEKL